MCARAFRGCADPGSPEHDARPWAAAAGPGLRRLGLAIDAGYVLADTGVAAIRRAIRLRSTCSRRSRPELPAPERRSTEFPAASTHRSGMV
jgi:hypothetical protein